MTSTEELEAIDIKTRKDAETYFPKELEFFELEFESYCGDWPDYLLEISSEHALFYTMSDSFESLTVRVMICLDSQTGYDVQETWGEHSNFDYI